MEIDETIEELDRVCKAWAEGKITTLKPIKGRSLTPETVIKRQLEQINKLQSELNYIHSLLPPKQEQNHIQKYSPSIDSSIKPTQISLPNTTTNQDCLFVKEHDICKSFTKKEDPKSKPTLPDYLFIGFLFFVIIIWVLISIDFVAFAFALPITLIVFTLLLAVIVYLAYKHPDQDGIS